MKIFSILFTFLIIYAAAAGTAVLPAEESDLNSSPPMESNIDFSGIEKFLELTAVLEKDEEPPKELWDELFSTPGYRILLINEFKRDFFEERFRLAFMPSREKELNARMEKEKGWVSQFLPHFVRARKERDVIVNAVETLKEMTFIRAAVNKALAWLPEFEVTSYPPVSFVIFGPDARGYVPVVLDIFYTLDRGEGLTEFVGHEFHHYYKDLLAGINSDVQWVIRQVHAEGIADQINVGAWFRNPERYKTESVKGRHKSYLQFYEKSAEIISDMNRIFERLADGKGDHSKLGKELRNIVPLSGHPTGFFMANTILKRMGKNALIIDINDTPAFFRRYSEAAGEDPSAPAFSDKSLEYLKKYSRGK